MFVWFCLFICLVCSFPLVTSSVSKDRNKSGQGVREGWPLKALFGQLGCGGFTILKPNG